MSLPSTPTWRDLPVDLHISILSRLPLPDALSLHTASPTPATRRHVRRRIAILKPLRDAWVAATQPSLRCYANPSSLRTSAARKTLSPAHFAELTRLPVGGVDLQSLQGIAELPHLITLDASRNCLPDVPREIARCTQLRTINLGKNCLSAFPDVLLKLPQLSTLLLHHNHIATLPTQWTQVKQLCRLGLFDCAIAGDIPEQLCQILGTQTEARRRRSANLQRNRLDQGVVDGLFRRFPRLASAVVI